MSDVPQGPGWWQASDGKWYSPQQAPGYAPPGYAPPGYAPPGYAPPGYPPPAGYAPPGARRTNPLAVAAVVLSLAWLGGLGSLLAVIFAIAATSQIRRSRGAETGEGLAVAGLVLGIIGLIGAVVVWLLVATVETSVHVGFQGLPAGLTPRTVTVAAGQPIAIPDPDAVAGITRVTVFSMNHPVSPTAPYPIARPGKELAAADIEVCAGTSGSQHGVPVFAFNLVLPGGALLAPLPGIEQPDLYNVKALSPNACARGYLGFEIANGAQPSAVRFLPGPFRTYEWALSQPL